MIPHNALILLLFAMAVAMGYQRWSAAERRREDAAAAAAWCEAERAAHQRTCDQANRLRAAFDRYARHDDDCLTQHPYHYEEARCDCGYRAALAALETQP